jgi:penicillin amidase
VLAWGAGLFALALLLGLGLREIAARRAVVAAHPQVTGTVALPGLGAAVEVVRDRNGVPHVFAAREDDAWRALGFVHAQDRLAQMAWLRRAARGRTAEVVGPAGVSADRWARTLGLTRAAEAEWRALPAPTREVLEAYAAGVSARIERVRSGLEAAPLPLDEPAAGLDPWTALDTLALWKLHAWALGGTAEESMTLLALIERLGGEGARPLFPRGLGLDGSPVAPDPLVTALGRPPADPLRAAAGLSGRSVGSTALAVIGRGGLPLLAADAHFAAQMPAHYYEAHLRGGDLEVAGATLPGIPAFWTGFNSRVAWASTHVPVLVADLLVETLRGGERARYHDGARWRPVDQREELIAVRGRPDVRLRVRETARGPLVEGLLGSSERGVALHWTGFLPGGGPGALLRVAKARSAEEVRAALATHAQPVLDVVFADREGRGGRQLAGAIPRRPLASGGVPNPARNPGHVWTQLVPFDALPGERLGPDRPFVIAADGPLAEPRSGIEVLWRSGARAARIADLLAPASEMDLERLVAIQRDVFAPGASEVVERALALAGAPGALRRDARELAALLAGWDRAARPDSVGAAAYHVFLTRLIERVYEPVLGRPLLERYLGLRGVSPGALALLALRAAQGEAELPAGWAEPEAVRSAVRRTLAEAWIATSVQLGGNREKWTWGRLHRVRFAPLAPEAWRRHPSELGPLAYGGDGSSVQVAEYRGLESFDASVVATFRFVAEVSDLDQALTSLAPGQSEHPGHPHAQDGVERWVEGRASLLSTSRPVIEDGEVARLTLVPAP